MRILVIGGTRFMGPSVVNILQGQGHEVTVFHRGQTATDLPSEVQQMWGDRANLAAFGNEFERLAPEIVLDMISFSEQNARTFMDVFKGIARRVVVVSSGDVYRAYGRALRTEPGPPDAVPLTEDASLREKRYPYRGTTLRSQDDPQRWMDEYDKIPVEHITLNTPELPGTILRLPMVYGLRDYQHRLFDYLKRMNDNRPVILLDEGIACWRWTRGYVENVATAIALAVTDERATGRIYNVGEETAFTTAEWVRNIGKAVGWNGQVMVVPKDQLPPHLSMNVDTSQDIVTNTKRIRSELGYREPISFTEGLERTVEWERANPLQEIDLKQFDYAAEDAALAKVREGQ